jgi:hypothetical protein
MGGLLFIAVIIAWFCFCVWLARKVARWIPIESMITKAVSSVLAFGLFFPLPLIDEIIGKFQFDKLCREEAGVKIYGKLELGPEFFNADGTPNFFPSSGEIDDRMKRIIEFTELPIENITDTIEIHRYVRPIKERKNGAVLATLTSFSTSGGWLSYDHRPWLIRPQCYPEESILDVLQKISTKSQ